VLLCQTRALADDGRSTWSPRSAFLLSAGVTGGIDPAAAALLGLLVAANTKPFAPAALTGLLTAVGTLLVALGVKHVSGGEVSAVNAVVAIVMANVLRAHVSPVSGRRTETGSSRAHKAEVPPIGRAATARGPASA